MSESQSQIQQGDPRSRQIADAFYEHIKHGDDVHRAWLRTETDKFFAQHSVQQGDPAPASAPKGWKLVPNEPTPEMMVAVDDAYGDGGDFADMWEAALAAAPSHVGQGAERDAIVALAVLFTQANDAGDALSDEYDEGRPVPKGEGEKADEDYNKHKASLFAAVRALKSAGRAA